MLGFLFAKNRYDFVIHLAGNGKMKPSQIRVTLLNFQRLINMILSLEAVF